MSLINQMLKDLDERREDSVRGRLHREVRPLPAAASPGHGRLLIIGITVAFAALLGGWFYQQQSMAPATPSPAAPALVAPATPPAPIVPEKAPAPVAVPAEATPLPVSVAPAVAVDDESGMKLSAALDKLPPPVVENKGAAPVKPIEPAPKTSPAATTSSPKVAPAATPATTKPEVQPKGASGTIEKQVPQARSGRERAEQDYQRAVTLLNGARVSEAIEQLLHGLQQDGSHVAARQLLARLLIEQRSYDEAAAILAEGVAAQPVQTGWAMSLARLQVEKSNLEGAAQTLQRSLPHALANADYLGFYGLVQYRLHRARESAELYRKAAQLSPAEGRWWLGLGLALEAGQQSAEARDAFLRARATGTLTPDLQALVDQKLR